MYEDDLIANVNRSFIIGKSQNVNLVKILVCAIGTIKIICTKNYFIYWHIAPSKSLFKSILITQNMYRSDSEQL